MPFKKLISYMQIRRVASLLPGANCAACGAGDCKSFAGIIVREQADARRCAVCDGAMIDRIHGCLKRK